MLLGYNIPPNFLFKDISGFSNMIAKYTSEGWTRLFNCYLIGEQCLNTILKQDILKSEKRVAAGRRAKNIGHHTIANMKKSYSSARGRGRSRILNREKEQELPSNTSTIQSLNSNTFIFNSFNMPSNPNDSFDQNINNLNNTLHNIQLNSQEQIALPQSNLNAEIQNPSNIQVIYSPLNLIESPCPTKRTKRITHTRVIIFRTTNK